MSMYEGVIDFWFEELTPDQWWNSNDITTAMIKDRFSQTHEMAINGELFFWRETPLGRLAEIIVIDQFSRNLYKGKPQAFAWDSMALTLSQEAIANGCDQKVEATKRKFFYLPFMHSESRYIHEICLPYFSQEGMEENLEFELKHKRIIDRFGRYPHRNDVLGRESSPEEKEFLQGPDSSF